MTLPSSRVGISFLARVDDAHMDWRGGVLCLTGQVRRSIAYMTNARLVENHLEPEGQDVYRVRLQFEPLPSDGTRPVLL